MDSTKVWDWLFTTPWMGYVLAVAAIVVSVVLYYRQKKETRPCYAIRSNNIIKDSVTKLKLLEVFYADTPVKNLTVTKAAVWNAGRETIRGEDIAKADPLKVSVAEGCSILSTNIIYETRLANQLDVNDTVDIDWIGLHFDYLDKDDGVIIQLLHTGTSGSDIAVTGTIKGFGKLVQRTGIRQRKYPFYFKWQPATISILYIVYILAMLVFIPSNVSTVVVLLMAWWPLSYVFNIVWAYFGPDLMPRGFDAFFNDEL